MSAAKKKRKRTEFRCASDEQREQAQREALTAAALSLTRSGVVELGRLSDTATWRTFREAMNDAHDAVARALRAFCKRKGLDYVDTNGRHIVLSALWATLCGMDVNEMHPYCEGGAVMLAAGHWVANLEISELFVTNDELAEEILPEPKRLTG